MVSEVGLASSHYYELRQKLLQEEHDAKMKQIEDKRIQQLQRHELKMQILQWRLYREQANYQQNESA